MIFGVIQHGFNKLIYIKEVLNMLVPIMRVDGKTHLAIMYKPTLEKA
jgi:hypothetical protein